MCSWRTKPILSHFHIFSPLSYNMNPYYLLMIWGFGNFSYFIFLDDHDSIHIFYNLILLLFFLALMIDQIKNFSMFNLSHSIIIYLVGSSSTIQLLNH